MKTMYEDSLRPMNRLYRFSDQFGTSRNLRDIGFIASMGFPILGAILDVKYPGTAEMYANFGFVISQASLIPSDLENVVGHERKIKNGTAPSSFGIKNVKDKETGETKQMWSTLQTPIWDTYLRNGFGHATYAGLSAVSYAASHFIGKLFS